MIKKIAYFVTFLCVILFVNSLYAMYNNNNGKRNYTEEQNQENAKRAKYDDADQSNLNAPTIEQGNDVFVFDKDVTQSLQVNTFAKSLIFKVYPSEDQLAKIGLKFPNVQKIDISDILRDVSSDRKKKFLRELLNFQSLKELICNNNMLTDIELSILPAFTHASNNDNWLESIHLNQNLITDKGAKNIALMGRKLTELSITHNQIEESGALSIVKMPQLKKLSLDKNLISNESWHNIQKIATEKNLIFIENKEYFFKQTFTDNVVLNNEPKIQQTLIQNFTPVLPLSVQNRPYSEPPENPYYINNNNNQVIQNQNIKNNTYIFDCEAKKTIESYPKGGTFHINTIIFKIIPNPSELEYIKTYYKDVNKIDMSVLFGKKFLNIHRIKNDTWRSLLIDLKEFLRLKDKDAYFNQFIKSSYDQEPQKPFNFEKSNLYTEGELFRKKDIRNVFINTLFKESENSNNQIVASQKLNNYAPQVNAQQNNSNVGQNVQRIQSQNVTSNAKTLTPNNSMSQVNTQQHNSNNFEKKTQKENTKNNVYVFDLKEKRKINSGDRLQAEHIDTIIFKIIPTYKDIIFLRKNNNNTKRIDASHLFGKKYSNINPDSGIKKYLLNQFDDFIKNIISFKDNEVDISCFVKEAKENEPKKPLDIEKSRIYKERKLFKERNYPNVFINALFAESENSNNQIVTSQKPNNYLPQVNTQQHNSNNWQNVPKMQPQNMMPNPQLSMPNNYAPQVNTQQHNSNIGQNVQQRQPQNMMHNQQMPIRNNYAPQVNTQQNNSNIGQNVPKMQPQNMMPNPQLSIPNNYAPQVNTQQHNSNNVENKKQKENTKNNVYVFDLEAKRKINFEDRLQTEHIDTIIFKIIPTWKDIIFLRKNYKNIKRIDASSLFGKKYSNINPDSGIKKYLFTQFEDFIKNIIFFNDNKIDISRFVKEAKKNEPKKPLDIEKSRIYKERELFKEENYPNVFINALFAESENSNNQIAASQKPNNYLPQVNTQQHNSNIGQNVQQRQSHNMMPNPQMRMPNNYAPQVHTQQHNSNNWQNVPKMQPQNMMPNPQLSMPNNYAPSVNTQQHNSNIGQNVQRMQPQNMMPNQQMPVPNNYAPQVNTQQNNSNNGQNVLQRQPQNVMANPQMPIQNLASNTLIITEEKNNNDSDYKELLDLFYSEDIENPICNALEDEMFSFGSNERLFLQQGKPIFLERKINFLHFEICPTENEIFQLFQNFNFIEKINISFVLSKDKINKIKILAALKIFQNLKELTAEGNELTDEDIICIAQELPRLTLLNVDNNLIGDKGAVSVSQMQNLKKLYVKSNKIKDKGAREIAAMDNLEVFYYDNNEITPLGHRNIQQLREDVLFLNSLSEQN